MQTSTGEEVATIKASAGDNMTDVAIANVGYHLSPLRDHCLISLTCRNEGDTYMITEILLDEASGEEPLTVWGHYTFCSLVLIACHT